MTECNAIIEANKEIDRLKRENKKLNTLSVQYGFEMGRLEEKIEQLKREKKELKELVREVDNELEIRDIVCSAGKFRLEEWGKHRYHQFYKGDEELEDESIVIMLMELEEENKELKKENEELKQSLNEVKNDEKQLSIDFMRFKMKLIEQLQAQYSYANEQRRKHLDDPLLAKAYDIIRYEVRKLAEEMRVDLE